MKPRQSLVVGAFAFVALSGCTPIGGEGNDLVGLNEKPGGDISDDSGPRALPPGQNTFTISASKTDPFVQKSEPHEGPYELYLWLVCSEHGASAFEADVAIDGDELAEGFFEPHEPYLSIWWEEGGDLDVILPGCPKGPELLGAIRLLGRAGNAVVCLVPGEGSGVVDCTDFPVLHPWACFGWAAGEAVPPTVGEVHGCP